jgi:cell division septation protein DedD
MPKPDEAPIRFEAQARPRTFEAPALMPELSSGRRRAAEPIMPLVYLPGADAPLASVQSAEALAGRLRAPGGDTRLSLSEAPPPPMATAESGRLPLPPERWPRIVLAEAVAPSSAPIAAADDGGASSVAERVAPAIPPSGSPSVPLSAPDLRLSADERAEALARTAPNRARGAPAPALDWPELEADELPQAVLSRIDSPALRVPELRLAMVEMPPLELKPGDEAPLVVAKSAPSMAAAETRLEFVQGLIEALPETPATTESRPQPEPSRAPEPVLADATPPAAAPTPIPAPPAAQPPADTVITLEPTGPRPPQGAQPASPPTTATPPVATPPAVTPAPAAAVAPTVSGALVKGSFYIQVAAFRSALGANDAVAGLVRNGHVALVESLADARGALWRVYVGPLSRDEAGVALMRVRALGYRDAFVKQGG